MNKKVISLVLALVMVLGTFTSVFAAEKTEEPAKKDAKVEETKKEAPKAGEKVEKVVGKDNKIQYIVDKKFVKGYEDGSMGYDKNITRAEITRLLVLANGNEDLANSLQGSMKLYTDVDTKHWANGVISVGTTRPSDANKIAMLAGYPDKSFKPDQNVTYAELAKMLVVLVKKDLTEDMVKNAKWATSWMLWAKELGILEDIDVKDSNAFATRADAFTMVYNALFAMKEFKRVPANEVRGIISSFNKDKLVLNEDSTKEYKLSSETVFVTGENTKNQQIVKLANINLSANDYYLGSLVRVLINDKNEVTHIIQLGNPRYLAAGNDFRTVKEDNRVWAGVCDNTVETNFEPVATLEKVNTAADYKSYVTVNLNGSRVKANSITFHGLNDYKDGITLRVTDKTEVYVANPYNNQMRKLSGIVEALSLIGYKNYELGLQSFRIPNVYAGFDTDGARDAHKAMILNGERNTAKVIVFNVVSKDKGGENFRVLNSPSSAFRDTLEKADGSLIDRNNFGDISIFPLNYSEHLDVIEVYNFANGSNHSVLIDHDDYRNFPVVEVVAKDGSSYIEVVDQHGEKSLLDIRDVEIFSAKRFDKFSVGSKIQVRVENHDKAFAERTNVAEIISILPRDTKLEGSIKGVFPSVNKGEARGTFIRVNDIDGPRPTLTVDTDYNVFNAKDSNGYATYNLSKDDAKRLSEYVKRGEKIAFTVFPDLGWAGRYYATNFRVERNGKLVNISDETLPAAPLAPLASAESQIDAVARKYGYVPAKGNDAAKMSKLESCSQLTVAKAELAAIEKAMEGFKLSEKLPAEYQAAFDTFKAAIGTIEGKYNANNTKAEAVRDSFSALLENKLTESKLTKDEVLALLNTSDKKDATVKIEVTKVDKLGANNEAKVTGKIEVKTDKCRVCINFTQTFKYKCDAPQPAVEPEEGCTPGSGGTCPAPRA